MFSIWNRIISFSGNAHTNVYTFNSALASTNQSYAWRITDRGQCIHLYLGVRKQ